MYTVGQLVLIIIQLHCINPGNQWRIWGEGGGLRLAPHLSTDHNFYRAMHFSAKRGIAIACRLSVRPSVCDVGEL